MSTSTVRYRKVTNTGQSHWSTRYEVVVDGQVVGIVEAAGTAHDRKPRGARVATTRTHSNRWYYYLRGDYNSRSLQQDTRREAVERLLRDALGLSWAESEKLAKSARNETKAERA